MEVLRERNQTSKLGQEPDPKDTIDVPGYLLTFQLANRLRVNVIPAARDSEDT